MSLHITKKFECKSARKSSNFSSKASDARSLLFRTRIWLAILVLLPSCSYQFQESPNYSVCIPYVEGDIDGNFTRQLIETISYSNYFTYSDNGEILLKVCLENVTDEKIGFKRDREKTDGSIKNNLRPIEGRRFISAKVSVINKCSSEIFFGPYTITADADYDYVDGDSYQDLTFVDSKGLNLSVLRFSLGQLESIDSAQDTAIIPLYHRLSLKIVDVLAAEL